MEQSQRCILNSLFSINIILEFIKKKYKNYIRYHPSKLEGYKKLMQENLSYPSVKSHNQFKTIIETYTKANKLKYLARLVKIVNKSLRRTNDTDMIRHFVKYSDSNDNEHYAMLRKMYNNKVGGYLHQIDHIYSELSHVLKNTNNTFKITTIMDIGCGDGKKLERLGKKLNIKPSDMICADIDKWFDYSTSARDKKSFTKLKLELEGPIIYNKKVDVITMIHTVHHWCYGTSEKYIERMASLKDILNPSGYIVIIEHDIFTETEGCILDIEHGLYECMRKNTCDEFQKNITSRYLNFVEIEIIMEKAGFEIVSFQYYNAGNITTLVVPNKTYISIYKIKN